MSKDDSFVTPEMAEMEAVIREAEQKAIQERAGMLLEEGFSRPSWRESGWVEASCIVLFLVLLDITLASSLPNYGYPEISPLVLLWPLFASLGIAAIAALAIFLVIRNP